MKVIGNARQWVLINNKTNKILKGPHRGRAPIVTFLNQGRRNAEKNGQPGTFQEMYYVHNFIKLEDLTIAQIDWVIKEDTELNAADFYKDKAKEEKKKAIRSARYQGRRKLAAQRRAEKEGKL